MYAYIFIGISVCMWPVITGEVAHPGVVDFLPQKSYVMRDSQAIQHSREAETTISALELQ